MGATSGIAPVTPLHTTRTSGPDASQFRPFEMARAGTRPRCSRGWQKYRDQGMDLADACIVRMSELTRTCRVVTVDRTDFTVYRRNGREAIPILSPPEA